MFSGRARRRTRLKHNTPSSSPRGLSSAIVIVISRLSSSIPNTAHNSVFDVTRRNFGVMMYDIIATTTTFIHNRSQSSRSGGPWRGTLFRRVEWQRRGGNACDGQRSAAGAGKFDVDARDGRGEGEETISERGSAWDAAVVGPREVGGSLAAMGRVKSKPTRRRSAGLVPTRHRRWRCDTVTATKTIRAPSDLRDGGQAAARVCTIRGRDGRVFPPPRPSPALRRRRIQQDHACHPKPPSHALRYIPVRRRCCYVNYEILKMITFSVRLKPVLRTDVDVNTFCECVPFLSAVVSTNNLRHCSEEQRRYTVRFFVDSQVFVHTCCENTLSNVRLR